MLPVNTDDMILYIGNPKDVTRKLLELINEFGKVAGYKLNTQKSVALPYTNSEDLQDLLELRLKKDVLFIIGDWNAKVGSQETPGVTGKLGLGIQNEAGQRLREFCQENGSNFVRAA